MSPDPPREDSGDDESRIGRLSDNLIEGFLDDQEFFIVPDAPYELDMEDESDYSDSDEEEVGAGSSVVMSASIITPESSGAAGGGDTRQDSEHEIVIHQGQGRGRYRLLIPFTVDSSSSTNVSAEETTEPEAVNDGCRDSNSQNAQNSSSKENESTSTTMIGAESSSSANERESVSKANDEKREIELTDEKVETIMQVMKNITLPPASIPKWASEVDEDTWRRKLTDSIGSKSCNNKRSSVDNIEKTKSKDTDSPNASTSSK